MARPRRQALEHNVTVLAASGDSGAADVGPDGQTYYLSPVTSWPASDPLVTGVGGTQLHLNASGNHTSPDTLWNDTYSVPTNKFIFGDNGPNPLASGGGSRRCSTGRTTRRTCGTRWASGAASRTSR